METLVVFVDRWLSPLHILRARLYTVAQDYCGINRRESINVFAQLRYIRLLWRDSASQSVRIKRFDEGALFCKLH